MDGRRSVERDCDEELDARDTKEVLDGLRVKRDRRDDDELDRGAAAGMTMPDFLIEDLENLGALPAKSGVESEGGGAGIGTESDQRPLNLVAAVG